MFQCFLHTIYVYNSVCNIGERNIHLSLKYAHVPNFIEIDPTISLYNTAFTEQTTTTHHSTIIWLREVHRKADLSTSTTKEDDADKTTRKHIYTVIHSMTKAAL